MPDYQYDLFVIGAGSGGVRAARVAAKLGAHVALAESRYLGGTCVNVGCVPKKLFFYASHFSEEFKHATDFGWSSTMASFDWKTLIGNKNNAIKRLNDLYRNLLDGAGVEIITGHATITGEHEITVDRPEIHRRAHPDCDRRPAIYPRSACQQGIYHFFR